MKLVILVIKYMSEEKIKQLFAGEPNPFGGLSNEQELTKIFPKEFNERNKWSDLASSIFFGGANTEDWKFKDKTQRQKQLNCLRGLLGTFGISHGAKEAIGGWMLSEMLVEIPKT